jgi:hypothetical protein
VVSLRELLADDEPLDVVGKPDAIEPDREQAEVAERPQVGS